MTMENLSIEEKAKRYDVAIEKFDVILNLDTVKESGTIFADDVRKILPELKESEDERVRKELFKHLKEGADGYEPAGNSEDYKRWLGWFEKQGETFTKKDVDDAYLKGICDAKQELEKQGEQKPTDKVESKFKVGDWVVVGDRIGIIIECTKDLADIDLEFSCLSTSPKNIRSWTIQDAKDGDVLCTYECGEPKIVFILKGMPKKHCVLSYYCYYNIMYPHFESDSEKGCLAPNDEDVKPATKEQRDTLFAKMTDAGYKWDAEKKELTKIGQNPAWSEEDEDMKDTIIRDLKRLGGDIVNVKPAYKAEIDWLKSLKDRVQPQNQWKPSEEQIKAVRLARSFVTDDFDENPTLSDVLVELEKQLKKLREE